MEIKTKFNVGDTVYSISYAHKLVEFEIGKVSVSAKANDTEIDYYPSDGKGGYKLTSFAEKYCFATEDEALAYIKGE